MESQDLAICDPPGKDTKRPVLLLKFGQLTHLQDLLYNGKLYVNSIQNLRTNEDDSDNYRVDTAEGARRYVSTGPTKLTLTSVLNKDKEPICLPAVNVRYFDKSQYVKGNICSFYAITEQCFKEQELITIDPKMSQFGPYFILIKDSAAFIKRIRQASPNATSGKLYSNHVEYFNEDNFVGDLHLFQKRSSFAYQKEFRFYFETDLITPLTIDIGNIENIAKILSSDLLEHLEIKATDKCETYMDVNVRWPEFKYGPFLEQEVNSQKDT